MRNAGGRSPADGSYPACSRPCCLAASARADDASGRRYRYRGVAFSFDGKSLAGWKESDFFGAGKVSIENGVIMLGTGALTGITWAGSALPFPTSNYEIRIEAARLKGSDFFAGITFPVRDAFCTWINGGWGGRWSACRASMAPTLR